MKKVTTITPCHNSTGYLKRCWESLKNQTIGLDQIEIIFVDDASDDDGATWDLLLTFEKEAPDSVLLIRLDENLRQGGARNVGLSYAGGEYIQFLDSDDYLEENALEELYRIAKEKDCDILQHAGFYPEGLPPEATAFANGYDFVLSRKAMLKTGVLSVTHWSKFYRHQLLKEAGVRFAEHVIFEEPLFVYPLFFYAKKISVIPDEYYRYCVNDTSTMNSSSSKRIGDHVAVQNMVYGFLKARPEIYDPYQAEIDSYYYYTCIIETLVNIARGALCTQELSDLLVKSAGDFSYSNEDIFLFGEDRTYLISAILRVKEGFSSIDDLTRLAMRLDRLITGDPIRMDIVVSVASRGGMENVLNQLCDHLSKENFRLRVVQLVDIHVPWLTCDVEYRTLSDQKDISETADLFPVYEGYLYSQEVSDLVLCTGWPLITKIVGDAQLETGKESCVVSYLHGDLLHYYRDGVGGIDELAQARGHLCINKGNLDLIKEVYPDTAVYRIANPVPEDRPQFSRERNPYSLIYVGRLDEEKNPGLILQALEKSPTIYSLKIFGEGPLREELIRQRDEMGLDDRVVFMDWVDNPWEYAKKDGFLVISSHYEGFSLVAAEALLSGMPVISTPVQGVVADTIVSEKNGYIYDDGDVDGLVSILTGLYEGVLPIPKSEDCFMSAEKYLASNVLSAIRQNLYEIFLHS